MTDPELVNDPFQQDTVTKEWTPVVSGGGTNITTNVGGGKKLDETLDTEEGKIWSGHQQERNIAAGAQADFQILDELITMAPQGPIIGNLAKQPILKNFSSAGQALSAVVKRVAPTLRVVGSGSTSDIEYQGMLDSLPDLGNYPEANSLIVGMMKAKAAGQHGTRQHRRCLPQRRNLGHRGPEAAAGGQQRSIMNPELQALLSVVR